MIKIGLLGGGNMASAIAAGVLKQGLLASDQIAVFDINHEKKQRFASAGHPVFHSVEELVRACSYIILAVKPQVFPQVLPQVKQGMSADKVLVSIAAGITAQAIQEAMGFPCKVVLVMPNTPILLGKGSTALSRVEPTTQAEFDTVQALFASAGLAEEIAPDKMNEIIPVNGSSPAFVYLFAKVIVDCAQKAGIDPAVANRLFCQALIGSAQMMLDTDQSHQQLIDTVCSPGGATLAGLDALEQHGFSAGIEAAFAACVRRAGELSQ